MPETPPDPPASPPGPRGLLLSRDLIFTTKVTGTARALGHQVLVATTSDQALAMIDQWRPRAVVVDLAAGDLTGPEALVAYRKALGDGSLLVAFGSHVDTDRLAVARASGCDEVLVRSQFSGQLPDLIRRYLG